MKHSKTTNNQQGFGSHALLILVVVIVGLIGVFTVVHSRAALDSSVNQPSKQELALIAKEENVTHDGPSDENYSEIEEGTSPNPIIHLSDNPASTLELKIASWNVFVYNKKDVAGNVKKVLKKADVLGIQEGGRSGGKLLKKVACATCAYEMYPKEKGTPKKVAILWNKTKFTLLSSGFEHLSTQRNVKKYVVWVKLRENTSGKIFYTLNTHFPFNATTAQGTLQKDNDGTTYRAHMKMLADKIAALQPEQLPIFLTGDLNADYRTDKCKAQALPCRSLSTDLSIKSGWEYMKLKGMGKTTGTASSTRIIDYILSWDRDTLTYESMRILYGGKGKGWGGSDHKPIVLTVNIGKS